MRKTILLITVLLSLTKISFAQDFAFGQVTSEEMSMQKYDKDTSAHAVVLNEHGRAELVNTNDNYIKLIYDYHVKIKIFDKSAFDKGDVEIPLYNGDGTAYEETDEIKGVTTFTDNNGNVSKIELEHGKIYTIKDDAHHSKIKFTMPGLRDGCVIEYSYKFISPYITNFQSWQFQSDIPKIYSEFDAHIPGFWDYNASIVGPLKLTKQTSEVEPDCFSFGSAKAGCSHLTFGIKDIPAFRTEDYMTAPKNFRSAINFELSQETDLSTGALTKVAKDWKDIDYDLKHDDYFGGQLKKEGLFKDKITPLIAGKTDGLEKAKIIYAYVKKIIKWNDDDSFFSSDGIKQAIAAHTGNAAEVNFCLFNALKAAGFDPEAVMLSTRNNGLINKLYPVKTEFDYTIVRLAIGDKVFLLDATDPLLSFGMLPLRCLNDQGRVMSLDKPSYWIDMNTPQRENDTYNLEFTLQTDGKIKGTIIHYSTGYSAYEKRTEIKKFNSVDEYIENINSNSNKLKIVNSEIKNLDSLDAPIEEKFTVEIKEFNNTDHSRLALNPFITGQITVNPFKLSERSYPVDWGMPSAERYTMIMHLPENYSIDTDPQKVGFTLPDNGGNFLTDYTPGVNTFTFSYVMQFNKSIYSPEEYPYLKEFYTKIILSEKNEMVLKKKM